MASSKPSLHLKRGRLPSPLYAPPPPPVSLSHHITPLHHALVSSSAVEWVRCKGNRRDTRSPSPSPLPVPLPLPHATRQRLRARARAREPKETGLASCVKRQAWRHASYLPRLTRGLYARAGVGQRHSNGLVLHSHRQLPPVLALLRSASVQFSSEFRTHHLFRHQRPRNSEVTLSDQKNWSTVEAPALALRLVLVPQVRE